MQIEQWHIDWLISEWVDNKIIEKAQFELFMREKRSKTIQKISEEFYTIQEAIRKGEYDESLQTLEIKVV